MQKNLLFLIWAQFNVETLHYIFKTNDARLVNFQIDINVLKKKKDSN